MHDATTAEYWEKELAWLGWSFDGWGVPPSVAGQEPPQGFKDVGEITVNRALTRDQTEVLGMRARGIGYSERLGAYGVVKQAAAELSDRCKRLGEPVTAEVSTPEGRYRLHAFDAGEYGVSWRLRKA